MRKVQGLNAGYARAGWPVCKLQPGPGGRASVAGFCVPTLSQGTGGPETIVPQARRCGQKSLERSLRDSFF